MRSLQLVLLGLVCVLGDPDVFDNYFDDSLRFVDVPQDVVLNACLPNGEDTVKKIQKAYDKCFGEDYSFDDLADTVGSDSDNDDLPDEYEGNEACFYKTMDWVKGNEVQPSVIEADMAGVPGFDIFKANINSCSAWSGNFGGRRKRAVGDAPEDNEEVPSIMDNGSGALQWVKSLVRRARSAEPGDGNGKNGKQAKKGQKKGKGKGGKNGAQKKNRKGKGKKKGNNARKSNKNKGKRKQKGKGKKGNRSATKKGKGNKKGKGKKGKNNVRKAGKGKGKGKKNGRKNPERKKRKGKKDKKDKKGKKDKKDNKGRKGKKGKKEKKDKNEKKQQRKQERKEKKKENKKKDDEKKKGRSGKSSDLLPDFVYNQLWCFDLAMEQALEQCVEVKLNN